MDKSVLHKLMDMLEHRVAGHGVCPVCGLPQDECVCDEKDQAMAEKQDMKKPSVDMKEPLEGSPEEEAMESPKEEENEDDGLTIEQLKFKAPMVKKNRRDQYKK